MPVMRSLVVKVAVFLSEIINRIKFGFVIEIYLLVCQQQWHQFHTTQYGPNKKWHSFKLTVVLANHGFQGNQFKFFLITVR